MALRSRAHDRTSSRNSDNARTNGSASVEEDPSVPNKFLMSFYCVSYKFLMGGGGGDMKNFENF